MDLAISITQHSARWLMKKHLTEMTYQVLWNREQINVVAPLSLDDYLTWPHLQLNNWEATSHQLDNALSKQGMVRHVGYTTSHFVTLPNVVQKMPMMATIPTALAVWQQTYP